MIARHAARALLVLLSALAPGAAPAATPTWEVSLADSAEPGRPFTLEGRVFALPDSQPLRGVTVLIWHADARGEYGFRGGQHARLEGRTVTNVLGAFRVRTVLPGKAEGFAHMHFTLSGAGLVPLTSTLNLARSHGAGSDSAYGNVAYMLDPTPSQTWAFVEPTDAGFRGTCRLYVRRAPR